MNKIITILIVGVAAVIGIFLLFNGTKNIEILKGKANTQLAATLPVSSLSGVECDNYSHRPVAVMIASDPETRPLSGLSEADMVFEMPVEPSGITRMMAVFQCNLPKEIGSIRSARLDFIPLVQGLDAIYLHWGGEREALTQLDAGIVENIDALKYEEIYFYRKKNKPRPHNGFISPELINKGIEKFSYSRDYEKSGYGHKDIDNHGTSNPPTIFSGTHEVKWEYSQASNSYSRLRNNKPEVDLNNNKQVEAKNIVIMETTWSPIDINYIRVDTVGSGKATVYQNGHIMEGRWDKSVADSRLIFLNSEDKEISFVPGQIWIEIVIK